MDIRTEIIKVELANGTTVHIQATALGREEEVAFTLPSFKEVTDSIEGIAESVVTTLQKVKPALPKKCLYLCTFWANGISAQKVGSLPSQLAQLGRPTQ